MCSKLYIYPASLYVIFILQLEVALNDESTSYVDESTSLFWVANVQKVRRFNPLSYTYTVFR